MLAKSLPLPKHKYETHDDEVVAPAEPVQVKPAASSKLIPSYPNRNNGSFIPVQASDFNDGGAYPEIHVVQYPLDLGRPGAKSTAVISVNVDQNGQVSYDALVKQGSNRNRIVQTSLQDIKEKEATSADAVALPDEKEQEAATERTKLALEAILDGKIMSSKPSTVVKGSDAPEPTYIKYTPNPTAQGGSGEQRIIRMVEAQVDPLEPPKHKHKKAPRGPPTPPVPVLHSPPRKLTVADQQAWKVPPCISNWKNARGYTIPLDKRLAADGRGLQEVTINNKFAMFSEALYITERKAAEDLRIRNQIRKKMALKEKEDREQELRDMALKARMERGGLGDGGDVNARINDDQEGDEEPHSGDYRGLGRGGNDDFSDSDDDRRKSPSPYRAPVGRGAAANLPAWMTRDPKFNGGAAANEDGKGKDDDSASDKSDPRRGRFEDSDDDRNSVPRRSNDNAGRGKDDCRESSRRRDSSRDRGVDRRRDDSRGRDAGRCRDDDRDLSRRRDGSRDRDREVGRRRDDDRERDAGRRRSDSRDRDSGRRRDDSRDRYTDRRRSDSRDRDAGRRRDNDRDDDRDRDASRRRDDSRDRRRAPEEGRPGGQRREEELRKLLSAKLEERNRAPASKSPPRPDSRSSSSSSSSGSDSSGSGSDSDSSSDNDSGSGSGSDSDSDSSSDSSQSSRSSKSSVSRSRTRETQESRARPASREVASSSAAGPASQRPEEMALQQREKLRLEKRKERERELRLDNMKGNFRKNKMERDAERDVSEKIALGMMKGGAGQLTGEALFDSRLFNQSAGMDAGFGADDDYGVYSKPLFERGAVSSVYRPKRDDSEAYGDPDAILTKLKDTSKFQPDKGFKGTEGAQKSMNRSEPVQFERATAKRSDESDPYGIEDIVQSKKSRNN